VPAELPLPDRLLASILVEQGVLTEYQADQLLAGRTKLNLGPYIITDWVGQGGMGQVFKAVHQVMGRECAVKVLPRARATQLARDAFRREIRMQAGLDCEYLVRAFDAGQDGNVHYLVTEYVPGMDLRKLIKTQGALRVQQAARIIMQAALGLEYAHGKGLVHRDVKPGNILVTPSGDAKVSDVGLAGFAKDLMNDPRAGKIVGTTDYLSPEQIRTPLEIQPASDIYSLGCTLYYAVCGKVPFPGGDTASKMRRHLEETPWHPRRFAPEINEDFVDIIADMMEKDPRKRITSAAEVAARLEPWATDNLGVGPVGMTRSPWMAPPPPFHEEEQAISVYGEQLSTLAPAPGVSTLPGESSDIVTAVPSTPSLGGGALLPGIGRGYGEPESDSFSSLSSQSEARSLSTAEVDASASGPSMSRSMLIALTIAIVVPPALLLGAILGYLAAQ
jgi:serine/threonine protein kinase